MKKNILITCSLLVTLLSFGQHTIILRTGEKLNGQVIGGRKDSINFNFFGNKLHFAHSDIKAIYFVQEDEVEPAVKPTLAAPAVKAKAAITAPTNEEVVVQPTQAKAKVNIGGTINYYLTKQNISKADSGAQVIVVDSTKVPTFNIAIVDTFHFGNAYREIYQQYKMAHTKVPADIPEQLAIWKADNKNNFDLLSRRVYKNIKMIKNSPDGKTATTDFRGQFSIPVEPGTYYVYVVSNNAQGQTIVDQDGKIYCRKVVVKGDQDELFKTSFDVF